MDFPRTSFKALSLSLNLFNPLFKYFDSTLIKFFFLFPFLLLFMALFIWLTFFWKKITLWARIEMDYGGDSKLGTRLTLLTSYEVPVTS